MQQQASIVLYRFRFLLAGTFVIAFFMLLSALVTALGSNTVLDTKPGVPVSVADVSAPDTPNVVTTSAYGIANGAQHVLVSTGSAIYGTCRSITMASTHGGKTVLGGSEAIFRGVGSGIAFVGRGVGGGAMFTLRLPGKLIGSVGHVHTVGAILRPSEDKSVPVIDSETSAAILANLGAQQKQQVASLQAAQVAANAHLGGSIVAGDPNHGGYPARWDNTAQDSHLDSWGMYNRECVSYAAWKVFQTYGSMPYWGGVGNANQWVRDARSAGIPTSSVPRVHSVAISMRGYYGHAMWVEAVNGNMIYVSQYNYDLHGHYSEMWVSSSYLTYIYFK